MADQNAKIDSNRKKTLLGITDDVSAEIRRLLIDPTTGRLKVSALLSDPVLDNGESLGTGTSYTLTTSLAQITFGTSGALELTLPDIGTYEITCQITEDATAVTASAAANYSLYKLYTDSGGGYAAVANEERLGLGFPIIAAALAGVNKMTQKFSFKITTTAVNQKVALYAKQNSATTGDWVISTGATGETKLNYKRIA